MPYNFITPASTSPLSILNWTAFTADVEASTSAILAYQPETSTPWKTGAAFESGKSFLAGITTTAHTDAGIDSAVSTMITANTNAGLFRRGKDAK